ncbi:hypothetical protein F511_13106 [Dorcoceras hygrometricum]|uniref:Uncharacterized protein n=1 Tax=Dorcoceras hygrometricum TaxID=472368 RepID=A0A2Z7ATY2_9LAMI|nr:hypothetical protein F511_13106 [Dorcoceras hygrometricum]
MVKRLATSPHDPIGITDSACKNQLVVVNVQSGPFNTYIPIKSTTIGKSRVSKDPIAMHTSWRSNSDIARVTSIGYPRMKASGESSTTKHRLLHASGPHPIPPPNDPKMVLSGSPATYIDAVNRAVDIEESLSEVEAPIQPTTGHTYQPVQDASQSFYSPQGSQQQTIRQRIRPRGKQFKKKANSSSSGSASLVLALCQLMNLISCYGVGSDASSFRYSVVALEEISAGSSCAGARINEKATRVGQIFCVDG